MPAEVRLQKFLAECGVGSRRKMEELISRGKVRVNGETIKDLGSKVDPETDKVEVNRVFVQPAPKGIILLNKPRGMVSTLEDPEGRPTVADYITKHYRSYFPVGRLDWDSTGLLILTNDGELAERLMHPRFQIERIYHARVEGSVPQGILEKLKRGIKLRDGIAKVYAHIIKNDAGSTWLEVTVREGRNRLVRRVLQEIGYPVIKLKRVSYGPFRLGSLQVGRIRILTSKEYDVVRRKVMNDASRPGKDERDETVVAKPPRFIRERNKSRGPKKSTRWGR